MVAEVGGRHLFDSDADHLKEHPLTVSVPTDRLSALEADLGKRVDELTRLSTLHDSSDPEFHTAYGAPEYLARAEAAHVAVSEYMHENPQPNIR